MKPSTILISAGLLLLTAPTFAQDLSAKTSAYIECYNAISGRAMYSIDRYRSWVKDMENGPTGKEGIVYGLYELNDYAIDDCKTSIPAAVAAEPKAPELDKAADTYLKATVALNEKVIEAERYYSRENYKDDGFAKGKAMHKPLVEAMQAFVAANRELSAQLEKQSDAAMRAQLVDIEKAEGKGFNYWMTSTMIEAKAAADLLTQETFDVAKAQKIITAYEDSADKLTDLIKSDDSNERLRYISLPSSLEDYRKAIKERMRRIRDNQPYSEGEQMMLNPSSGWMVDGSSYKVVSTYNSLVGDVNR